MRYLTVPAQLVLVGGLATGMQAGSAQIAHGQPVGSAQTRAPATATADSHLAKAVQLHEAGDLLGAVASYEAALGLQPDNPGAHSNLGAALVRLGRNEEGIVHYRRALELAPAEPSFRFNLALALYKSGETPAAVAELERVLAGHKDHLSARLLLGDCYLRMGRFQDTVDLLAPWEAEYGNDKGYGYVLGSAFVETDRPEHAQRVIDRIFAGQDSAEAHLVMATAHLRANDAAAAIT
jgi:Flp pilus assembly protein TadD